MRKNIFEIGEFDKLVKLKKLIKLETKILQFQLQK